MATNNNQNYEMMLIFTPVLADDEFKAAHKKFVSFIKENGGEIVHENAWGLKSLAYPIQKKTTGLYLVLEFKAPTDLNAKLEIQLNRDETVMRHMITHLDKYAAAYNERKRNAPAKAEAKIEETVS
jgi:small subunit ribosomal protein S6